MRIAASTYLNSAPLVYSFGVAGAQHGKAEFIGDAAPSRCAQMLASGQCEVALIPVIEYQRLPHLRIIPDVAVASKSYVRSVLLASRCPLEEVKTITLDTSSRTSQALVKILFAKRYQSSPRFIERTPDPAHQCENMFEASDAALIIGDPALQMKAQADELGVQTFDLAAEWRAMTGLPFVFAVWAAREDACADGSIDAVDFVAAKNEGLQHLDEIARCYALELNQPQADLLSYLRDNVNYDLDAENLAGMRRYFSLAHECGLIEAERELKFVS